LPGRFLYGGGKKLPFMGYPGFRCTPQFPPALAQGRTAQSLEIEAPSEFVRRLLLKAEGIVGIFPSISGEYTDG
jgi:hypothetical protein